MNDCSEPQPWLSVDETLQRLFDSIDQRPLIETRPLLSSVGRVLAESICSSIQVPPHDNSAMDGYALRVQDALTGNPLPVSQRVPAGVIPEPLQVGTAARIFTGAAIPEGADVVVMQEQCEVSGDSVIVPQMLTAGANIRKAGEDIQAGQTILTPAKRLLPQDIGLAASVGVSHCRVYRPITVALLCSGDELLEPGQPVEPGKIYNSNRYLLQTLLERQGFNVIALDTVEDTLPATLTALETAADQADVIVTTGGVSVGEEDHIKGAVEQLGSLGLWKVAIKPGKPFAFGHVAGTPFIGLPGNPVSVFVTFVVLALPYLKRLQGEQWDQWPVYEGVADFTLKKAIRRRTFLRVRRHNEAGTLHLEAYENQGSGVLSSVVWCDGLAVVDENQTVAQGDRLPYIPLAEILV